jgi:xylulokinase
MTLLGLDVGSSSVKAAILRDGRIVGDLARDSYPTQFDGRRAEVDPNAVLKAISRAIARLGPRARRVDYIGLAVMSPAWIAMDRNGKPLTNIITHQDRRSVDVARDLEARVGKTRFLKIAGNRPFPGSISITTLAWHVKHAPAIIRRADLIGHLNTFLHRQLTGARAIDPSNASFTGLYETIKLGGWNEELCEAARVSAAKLPEIHDADRVPGGVTKRAAQQFSLTQGTPMMTGMIDTGAAFMLFGPRPGRLLNVSGSTDVLCLCTDRPRPHQNLLTRALGVSKLHLSVGTIAAAGSAITWAHKQFFRDLTEKQFYALIATLARRCGETNVNFDPYLAGDRMSIEQKTAAFTNLTLATTREELLMSIIDALAAASAARLTLLKTRGIKIDPTVFISGGSAKILRDVLYRDWPGKWAFRSENEATLRGLSCLTPRPSTR